MIIFILVIGLITSQSLGAQDARVHSAIAIKGRRIYWQMHGNNIIAAQCRPKDLGKQGMVIQYIAFSTLNKGKGSIFLRDPEPLFNQLAMRAHHQRQQR